MGSDYITRDDFEKLRLQLEIIREAASITIKEYIDVRLKAIIESTTLAKESMEHRLTSLNELRGAMTDQSKSYLTKAEFMMSQQKDDDEHVRVRETLKSLELTRAEVGGKASRSSAIGAAAVGAIGVIISIVSLVLKAL